jgi:hypothetical protein
MPTNAIVGPRAAAALLFAAALLLFPSNPLAHSDPSEDGLIDGGGNPKTDCVSRFQTGLELNYPAAPKKSKHLACTDGDLACDTDGLVNGLCSFNVGLCLADDEDMPLCTPAGIPVGGVEVKNKPPGHPKYDADAAQLQSVADALLGSTGVPCTNPGAGGGNCTQCTADQAEIVVDTLVKKGKKRIKVKVITEPAPPKNKPIKDKDKLKLRCNDCPAASAFEHIADIVFKTGCAASPVCHTGPTAAAGMNLNIDEIGAAALHDELLIEAPTSLGAAVLGMARIMPGDPGLGTVSSQSLLYEKLFLTNNQLDALCATGGEPDLCLGVNMPPGSDTYSTGKLNLLKVWIEAGAPFDGWPAGATCGEPEDIWAPVDPPAPPAPGEGFQMHMEAPSGFTLGPGNEFQGCQWIEVPASVTEDWYIDRIEIVANNGTHHILLYEDIPDSGPPATPTAFDPLDAGCAKNFSLKYFRIGTQDPVSELNLPENVSYRIVPGQVFGFNPHYVNHYNVDIYPEVYVNFYGSTTPTLAIAGLAFPGNAGFNVPPDQVGTSNVTPYTNGGASGLCMFAISSHQHRRGTGIKIWTSEPTGWSDTTDQIYYSTDWDHPDVLITDPPLHLGAGDTMWFQCEWDNGVLNDTTRRCVQPGETNDPSSCLPLNSYVCFTDADCPLATTTGVCRDCDLDFGPMSEDDMCFIANFVYPAQADVEPCPWPLLGGFGF